MPLTSSSAGLRPRFRRPSPVALLRIDWLARAAQCHGRTLNYALALAVLAHRGARATVTPTPEMLASYGVSRDVAQDALRRLQQAGLVRAERGRGRLPRVTLLDAQGQDLKMAVEQGQRLDKEQARTLSSTRIGDR